MQPLRHADFDPGENPGTSANGFQGAVSNLNLVEVLQLEGQHQFSGSIAVASRTRQGFLYFNEGEIVHAESGELSGEDALLEMIDWPEGSFQVLANVRAMERTISKSLIHLLLDVHQRLDESRQGAPSRSTASPSEEHPPMSTPLERIRSLPEIERVVHCRKDGTPVGEQGPQAEALAAKCVYLALVLGEPSGADLGLGELSAAALHTQSEQLLLFRSRDQYLCASLRPGTSLENAEMAIRKAFASVPVVR